MRGVEWLALDCATHKKSQDRPMPNRLVGRAAPLGHQNQPPDGSMLLRRRYVARLP